MLDCNASADIKLNASSNWLCVFRQQYYKKTRTIPSLEGKNVKTSLAKLQFLHLVSTLPFWARRQYD